MRMLLVTTMVVVSLCAAASADVFNMPPGQTSLSFVPVGNPNNPSDPATIGNPGSVEYSYNIGKFEITIGQYAEFLNAVAASDSYGLYHPHMTDYPSIAGIARNGSAGSYSYSVIGTPDRPMAFVGWGSAARFANWLTNGQPSGSQNLTTTEDGSYFLNGATSDTALMAITRRPSAHYVIPSGNEWYKAAYYDPTPGAGGGDGYWLYPMQTNNIPFSDQPPGLDAPNASLAVNFWRDDETANGYNDGFALTGSPDYVFSQNYLTEVGTYAQASTHYGTFDQGGNLMEWTEATPYNDQRETRGASWDTGEGHLRSSDQTGLIPLPYGNLNVGFRLVEVPEPSSLAMLSIGALILPRRRRKLSC